MLMNARAWGRANVRCVAPCPCLEVCFAFGSEVREPRSFSAMRSRRNAEMQEFLLTSLGRAELRQVVGKTPRILGPGGSE